MEAEHAVLCVLGQLERRRPARRKEKEEGRVREPIDHHAGRRRGSEGQALGTADQASAAGPGREVCSAIAAPDPPGPAHQGTRVCERAG